MKKGLGGNKQNIRYILGLGAAMIAGATTQRARSIRELNCILEYICS